MQNVDEAIEKMNPADYERLRQFIRMQLCIMYAGTGEGIGSSDVSCGVRDYLKYHGGLPSDYEYELVEADYNWTRERHG